MQGITLLTTPKAAEFLSVSICAMNSWRDKGIGPNYARIGKRVYYRPEDLTAFIEDSMIEPKAVNA